MFSQYLLVFFVVCFVWKVDGNPRLRREIKSKNLVDANDCVKQCLSDGSSNLANIKSKYQLQLITTAKRSGISDASSPALKKEAIANVHDMFQELCTQSDSTKQCVQSCPASDLQKLTLIQHANEWDQVCYPIKVVKDFEAHTSAQDCMKKVREQNQCDQDCGKSISVSAATSFTFDDQSSPAVVEYESDQQKNLAGARTACKNQKCHIDCNKKFISDQCGQKAYDWYVRVKTYEPAATLASLRQLGVLGADEPSECADFTL